MPARAKTKKNNGSTKSDSTAASAPTIAPAIDSHRRRQTALVALGRRAIAPPDISLLIQDAAALIAETLETDRYGTAELSLDGKELLVRLGKTGTADIGDPLFARCIDFDPRESLAAQAIETAQVVVVPEPGKRFPLSDQFLKQQGVRAALLIPLVTADHSFGDWAPIAFGRGSSCPTTCCLRKRSRTSSARQSVATELRKRWRKSDC